MEHESANGQASGNADGRTCVATASCSATAKMTALSDIEPYLAQSHVHSTTSSLGGANLWDHFLARWGVNRSGHRVEPGLYSLGSPTPESPIFVSANYTLSFDALRWALAEIEGYILVLDTEGIKVWCAPGKGTASAGIGRMSIPGFGCKRETSNFW